MQVLLVKIKTSGSVDQILLTAEFSPYTGAAGDAESDL